MRNIVFSGLKAETGLPVQVPHGVHLMMHVGVSPVSTSRIPQCINISRSQGYLASPFFPTQLILSHIFPSTSDFPCVPTEIRSPKYISTSSCPAGTAHPGQPGWLPPPAAHPPTLCVLKSALLCIKIHIDTGTLPHIYPFQMGLSLQIFFNFAPFPTETQLLPV